MDVQELKLLLQDVPEDAVLIGEEEFAGHEGMFSITQAFPVGRNTDDPGLILRLRRWQETSGPDNR